MDEQFFYCLFFSLFSQIVFDEKELRREISHAIKNVHGVRQVEERRGRPVFPPPPLCSALSSSLSTLSVSPFHVKLTHSMLSNH